MLPSHLQHFHDEPIRVLDHGYIRLINCMGDDAEICDVARESTDTHGKGEEPEAIRKLIRRMMRKRHTMPFEFCEIHVEMKLPIFVSRQWIRHRTASVCERSMRYTAALPEQYVPEPMEWRGPVAGLGLHATLGGKGSFEQATTEYRNRIDDGIEKGQARICLPLSTYTSWRWKCDLSNTLNLLRQRLDKHAQWETRQYAEALAIIVKEWVPETWAAFEHYVLNAATAPNDGEGL